METGELFFIGFCTLAAINALFFAAYIWFKNNRNIYSSALLSLFLLITAYRIIQMLLHDLQDDFNIGINIKTFFFFIPTFPLIGPLLFLYVKSISVKDFQFRISHLLHLVPFLIFLVFYLTNRHNFPLSIENRQFYLIYCTVITVILIQFLIYLIISFIFARKLILKCEAEGFPKESLNPYWINNTVMVISIMWLIYALYCTQTYFNYYFPSRTIEALYYSLFSYLILYYELKDQKITFINNFIVRYKTSGLSNVDAVKFKSAIVDYVTKNEIYKDHNITLGKLSKSLSVKPHILSQVINEQLSCNFNDFINSYRIEEAKKLLVDPEMKNITVASIAYDSGFNTLSAFNTAFKKFTGITPSQYRSKQSQ